MSSGRGCRLLTEDAPDGIYRAEIEDQNDIVIPNIMTGTASPSRLIM